MSWYGDAYHWLGGQKDRLDQYNLMDPQNSITGYKPTDLSKGPDAQRLRDAATTFLGQYQRYRPTEAPTIDSADTGADRARQLAAMDYMRTIANGGGSPAEALARQGVAASAGAQLGTAAALQGPYAGASQRSGMIGASNTGIENASGLAALHADEQAKARQQLADAARALYGQDVDREQYQARLQQNQNQINNQYQLGLGGLTRSSLQAPYDAASAAAALGDQARAANQTFTGSVLGAAGQIYGASRGNDDEGGGGSAQDRSKPVSDVDWGNYT